MTYEVAINGRLRRVEVERTGTAFAVTLDGRRHAADVTVINSVWSLILAPEGTAAPRQSYEVAITEESSGRIRVQVDGRVLIAAVGTTRRPDGGRRQESVIGADGPQPVTSPMPGRVVKVLVKPGDVVAARQGVVVVEAMKMENELRAPKAGTVAEVRVSEGASVEAGVVLAIVE